MGGTVAVKIAVEEGRIVSVEVVDANETEGIGTRAIEELPEMIVEAQSSDVDNITGATVSSVAIKDAVADAIAQAGLAG